MAFTSSSLVDIVFKKFITGKSTVDNTKQYFEEPYSSRNNVFTSDVWLQSSELPNTAAAVSGLVQQVTATMTYVAGTKGGFWDSTGTLVDIIPFNYGDGTSYNYQIFRNNGTTTIPLGQCDWLFDPNSGVLTFYTGAVNGTITDPISSVVIANSSQPPVVKAWKYLGKKGVIPNLFGLTFSGGTMSVDIGTGLTYSGGKIVTSITSLNAGQGLTVSGTTYSAVIDSTRGLTFSGNNIATNIGFGLTFSGNGSIDSTLTTGFGLTTSGLSFLINLANNSGLTVSSSGLSINTSSIGTGLTFTGGILNTTNTTTAGIGLTNQGNTFSVVIDSNLGLTFSGGRISLNLGAGLTAISGQLQATNILSFGNGLVNNSGVISLNLASQSGLTVSGSGLAVSSGLAGSGLSFSNGQLSVTNVFSGINAGPGLTSTGNTFSVNVATASGLTFSGLDNLLNIRYDRTTNNTLQSAIGGITVGQTFSYTLLELLDKIFYPPVPFINPTISLGSISNREFGNTTSLTLSYTLTNNSGTITSARISSALGLPTNFVLTTLSSGSITATPSTGTSNITWTISGTYTDGTTNYALSSNSATLTYQNKRYWGKIDLSSIGNPDLGDSVNYPTGVASASALITSSTITSLTGAGVGSGNELSTSYSKTYTNINGGGQHLIFAWPTSFGSTPAFTVNGLSNTAFTKVKNTWGFTNSYGYNTNYDVWLSNTTQASSLLIVIS